MLLVGNALIVSGNINGPWPGIGKSMMAAGGLALLLQAAICLFDKQNSGKIAKVSLILSSLMALLLVGVVEFVLPATGQDYTFEQVMIQERLKRRNSESVSTLRGIEIRESYNHLGWRDKDWGRKTGKRIMLVGDSFLEKMSSRTLGQRLQPLLDARVGGAEVVSLGQAGTGPPLYRSRLMQGGFDLSPDLVVVFLFAGNDFDTAYTYSPYVHPLLTVSEKAAERVAREEDIPAGAKKRLADMVGQSFRSRDRFKARFSGEDYARHAVQAAYQYGLAYSPTWSPEYPNFSRWNIVNRTVDLLRMIQAIGHGGNTTENRVSAGKFEAVFSLPREERLDAMEKVLAEMLNREQAEVEERLSRMSDSFRAELIEEYESAYYLIKALEYSFEGPPERPTVSAAELDRVAREYARLFSDMAASASSHNASILFVIIPEASVGDADFRESWMPVYNYAEHFRVQTAIARRSVSLLNDDALLLDLHDYPQALRGGYWTFDGHWNERGNSAVAEIIAGHVADYLSSPAP